MFTYASVHIYIHTTYMHHLNTFGKVERGYEAVLRPKELKASSLWLCLL